MPPSDLELAVEQIDTLTQQRFEDRATIESQK